MEHIQHVQFANQFRHVIILKNNTVSVVHETIKHLPCKQVISLSKAIKNCLWYLQFKQLKYIAMHSNTDRNHATLALLRNMKLSSAFKSIW